MAPHVHFLPHKKWFGYEGSATCFHDREGWLATNPSQRRSRQYKHPSRKGRVTISGHPNDDVHPKTLSSILKQASLK